MTATRRVARMLLAMLVAASLMRTGIVRAGQPTMNECFEASEFIRNAALARDAGMRADVFLGRMEDDFAAIRAFPTDMRWFAHDDDDAGFLLAQAREVFDRPASADAHRANFLRACIDRMGTG